MPYTRKQASLLLLVLPIITVYSIACGLNDEGKNNCSQQSDCLDGFVCDLGTSVCELPGASPDASVLDPDASPEEDASDCVRRTCSVSCGSESDGCGGYLNCGACPNPGGTWATVADMPFSRAKHAAVYGPDDRIYVMGGHTPGGAISSLQAYTPATNSWTTLAPMITPRYAFSAVLGKDNRIYAIGGQNNGGAFLDGDSVVVEAYDPALNTWEAITSLPNGRMAAAAVAGHDDLIYAIGGTSLDPTENLDSAVSYDIDTGEWTAVTSTMNRRRSALSASVGADGRIYAVGGGTSSRNELEYYEPGVVGWNTLPDMPTGRMYLAAVTGINGRLFTIGGTGVFRNLDVVEVFSPATNTWTNATPMPTGRQEHAAVVAPDGKIYVFGGTIVSNSISTPITSVEVLTPYFESPE